MGRPKTANPKKEFIGTKTTKDFKVRFDKVCERKNLKGDDWMFSNEERFHFTLCEMMYMDEDADASLKSITA